MQAQQQPLANAALCSMLLLLLLLLLLLHIACIQPRHPHWFWQNHLFCPLPAR
jgi:hypothetical protein